MCIRDSVEDEQSGPVHERQDEADLLLVALGQDSEGPVELSAEAFGQFHAVCRATHPPKACEAVDHVGPGRCV